MSSSVANRKPATLSTKPPSSPDLMKGLDEGEYGHEPEAEI